MKKLLSLFGALGLLVFVATPIYAQEEETFVDDVVVEAENVVDEAVDVVDEAIDETAETIDETVELEWIEDFNSIFENEEVQNLLNEEGLTNEEAAGAFWLVAWLGLWMLFVIGIIGFVFRILRIIALWKAFERAGEPGWKALIPVYCTYIQYKLSWIKMWFWYALIIAIIAWIIAACIPNQQELITNIGYLITWIIYIVMLFKFARKYGWGVFASVLFVIFYPICVLILGFGNYPYEWKSEQTVVEA